MGYRPGANEFSWRGEAIGPRCEAEVDDELTAKTRNRHQIDSAAAQLPS